MFNKTLTLLKDSLRSLKGIPEIIFRAFSARKKFTGIPLNALAVLTILLSSCNRFDPVEHVFPNSLYLDVSAMEETHPSNFNLTSAVRPSR